MFIENIYISTLNTFKKLFNFDYLVHHFLGQFKITVFITTETYEGAETFKKTFYLDKDLKLIDCYDKEMHKLITEILKNCWLSKGRVLGKYNNWK